MHCNKALERGLALPSMWTPKRYHYDLALDSGDFNLELIIGTVTTHENYPPKSDRQENTMIEYVGV